MYLHACTSITDTPMLLCKLPPPLSLVLSFCPLQKSCLSHKLCFTCRSNVERLQGQLQTSESSNSHLKERVDTMEEELREATLERDGLRSLNERSSAELRRALEVRMGACTYMYMYLCVCVCVCVYVRERGRRGSGRERDGEREGEKGRGRDAVVTPYTDSVQCLKEDQKVELQTYMQSR